MSPSPSPGERFRPELTREELERQWARLEAAQRRRAMRQTSLRSVIWSLSVIVVAVVVGFIVVQKHNEALTLGDRVVRVGARLEVTPSGLAFDDGSRVRGLGASAEVEVVRNEAGQFATVLRRGSVHVRVRPGGPRRWTLDTEVATVEVVGTEFDVIQTDGGLVVQVEEGAVMVQGEGVPGRIRRLGHGDSLVVSRAPPRLVSETVQAPPGPSLDELFDRVSAARREGRSAVAEALLEEAMTRLDVPSERATVALELARAQLDEWHRPAAAVAVLEQVERDGAAPELVESAAALVVRALADSGRASEAREAATRYLERYPTGPWGEEVRRWAR